MKAKKLSVLIFSLMIILVISVFSASADEPCAHPTESLQWRTIQQTCQQEGYHELICTLCGDTLKTEIIPAHNFKVIYTGKTATCTEEGFEAVYCDWCNVIMNRNTPKNDNHSWSEWTVTAEPTCSAEGVKTRYCTRSGCVDAEGKRTVQTGAVPADKTKHKAIESTKEVIEPTCSLEGAEKYVCSECSEIFAVPVAIHSDYEGRTGADDAKDENGEYIYKYKITATTAATCTQRASTTYFCRGCGASFRVEGEKSNVHDFSDKTLWEYSAGATCQNPGTLTKRCKNNRNHTEKLEYAPHDFSGKETVITAPACAKVDGDSVLTAGKKKVQCLYCDVTEEKPVPAAHSFSDWVLEGNSSCKDGGTAHRVCTCGAKKETTSFTADNHLNYDVLKVVGPFCMYEGYLQIYCRDCKKYTNYFVKELESRGYHTPGDWVITTAPTCTSSGIKERFCTLCGESVEKDVAEQLDHNCVILKDGYAATCTETGLTDYLYCIRCTKTFEQEVTKANGHRFVEQVAPEEGSKKICEVCYQYDIADGLTCNCLCHNSNGLAKGLYKIVVFFSKIFGINQQCKCGLPHYEAGSGIFGGLTAKK
ncbi:MAG: hypothetical protein IKV21_01735 [Clostridia bacterium]|nr:hypothetical protein [Clostridia bacterium]